MSDINMTVKANRTRRLRTAGKYCDGDIYITVAGGTLKTSMEDGCLVTSFTRVIDGVETTTSTFKSIAGGTFSVPYELLCGDIDNLNHIPNLDASSLVSISLPCVTNAGNSYAFENCTSLRSAVFSAASSGDNELPYFSCSFRGCTSLETVDIGEAFDRLNPYLFDGTVLTALILRRQASVVLSGSTQITSGL